jgi:hypothetical protein
MFTSTVTRISVGIAAIVILIALYMAFTLGGTKANVAATTTTTSTPSTTSTAAYFNGGGPGQSYMSQREAATLVGQYGKYQASGTMNSTVIARMISTLPQRVSEYMSGNVTAVYQLVYFLNTTHATLSEVVYVTNPKSSAAQRFYTWLLSSSQVHFNATNATSDGMFYSYASQSMPSNTVSIIGWKNNEVTTVAISGGSISVSALVATVAGDMP